MNDWVDKLQQHEKEQSLGPIGDGWFTMAQWMDKLGYGDNKTRRVIRKAINEGKGKVFIGRQKNTCGLMTRQFWYKLDG